MNSKQVNPNTTLVLILLIVAVFFLFMAHFISRVGCVFPEEDTGTLVQGEEAVNEARSQEHSVWSDDESGIVGWAFVEGDELMRNWDYFHPNQRFTTMAQRDPLGDVTITILSYEDLPPGEYVCRPEPEEEGK